jgi:hypothetical protein
MLLPLRLRSLGPKPVSKPRRVSPPLSRPNQARLLRSLNLRAEAGDMTAAEAVLRLGMLAKAQTQLPA